MKHFAVRGLPAAFIVLGGLSGCAGNLPAAPAMYCPPVRVLQEANTLNAYLPGRSDVAAQLTQAKITGVAGTCLLNKKKELLEVTFTAGFSATNGPANQGAPLTLPYFVSISQGDTIISKTDYSITLNFEGNMSNATAQTKPVTVELSNVPDSADTDVLVGFQLTPAQLQAEQAP